MAGTISAALIVRNEARNLRECLSCIAPLVDEICVVDTGSTDQTLAVAREFKARLSTFIWCDDYSAIRNESLRLCTMDWAFLLDVNERVDPERFAEIRGMARSSQDACYSFSIRKYTSSTDVEGFVPAPPGSPDRGYAGWYIRQEVRMFPKAAGIRFQGKVHELVEAAFNPAGLKRISRDITVHHYPLISADGRVKTRHGGNGAASASQTAASTGSGALLKTEAVWREVLSREPYNTQALKNLGAVYQKAGRNEEAKKSLEAAIQLDPQFADAWRLLGMVYAAEQQWQHAFDCFSRVLSFDPSWGEGHRYVSQALEGLGRLDEAAASARRALEAAPGSLECVSAFIHLMLRLERRGEAREALLIALESGKNAAAIHNALAELFYYDKMLDEAVLHFRQAGVLGLAAAYNSLGVVFYQLRRFDDARQAFEQCIAMDPSHKGAQNNMQKVHQHLSP